MQGFESAIGKYVVVQECESNTTNVFFAFELAQAAVVVWQVRGQENTFGESCVARGAS
jgi:hypothetical protein